MSIRMSIESIIRRVLAALPYLWAIGISSSKQKKTIICYVSENMRGHHVM